MTTDRMQTSRKSLLANASGLLPANAGHALALASVSILLNGCWQGSDRLRDDIPDTGVAASVQADLPRDSQEAKIAAAVYKDGVAQPLVGGDVLQVRTDQSVATLRAADNLGGHYTGSLFIDNPETPLDVAVNYDQEASAGDRWFANDDLLVNPGPGSLVGYAVQGILFPPAVYLSSPTSGSVSHSLSDTVEIHWTPLATGDQMRATAAIDCMEDNLIFRYGFSYDLGIEDEAADGSYTLNMSSLVVASPILVTLSHIIEYMTLLITESLLGQEPGSLVVSGSLMDSTDQIDRCVIDVTLFREHDNALPSEFSGGYAITSRSDTVRIEYVPQ